MAYFWEVFLWTLGVIVVMTVVFELLFQVTGAGGVRKFHIEQSDAKREA